MDTNDRISVSLGQKVNLGNYESRDIHYSFSTDVGPDETVDKAKERAYELVKTWMVNDLERHRSNVQRNK